MIMEFSNVITMLVEQFRSSKRVDTALYVPLKLSGGGKSTYVIFLFHLTKDGIKVYSKTIFKEMLPDVTIGLLFQENNDHWLDHVVNKILGLAQSSFSKVEFCTEEGVLPYIYIVNYVHKSTVGHTVYLLK